jgi:Ser/Thr protein kinase RdoA (MazF antagonist)
LVALDDQDGQSERVRARIFMTPHDSDLRADDPRTLVAPWALRDVEVTTAERGISNRSWFIRGNSARYVLRLYSTTSRDFVLREHELLVKLRAMDLPFTTPFPVPTKSGASIVAVDTPEGSRFVALFEHIAGEHLDDDDVAGVEAAAAAFARLDRALASISTDHPSVDGCLDAVHPRVPDLDDVPEIGSEATSLLRRVVGAPSDLRGSLEPRQLIHDDFAFGNVLLSGGRVAGILDFEFAAKEARATELAIALRLVASKASSDALWRPLLRGYLSTLPLSVVEIEALPTLALHHEAVVLVWWLGRYRNREVDEQSLKDHVARALALDPWLQQHSDTIVEEALRIRASSEHSEHALRLARPDDAAELAALLHAAYADHAAAGLNFHAATVTVDEMRSTIEARQVHVVREAGRIVGTFQLRSKSDESGQFGYLNSLAIPVERRRTKFGAHLLALAEQEIRLRGWDRLRLDTAKRAGVLVAWYARRGYRPVGEVHWRGKTYDSVILEKRL